MKVYVVTLHWSRSDTLRDYSKVIGVFDESMEWKAEEIKREIESDGDIDLIVPDCDDCVDDVYVEVTESELQSDDCAMNSIQFAKVREKCKELLSAGTEIKNMVGFVYDLFQEYLISEEQEDELYLLVDPKEEFNECGDYWYEYVGKNPLLEVC